MKRLKRSNKNNETETTAVAEVPTGGLLAKFGAYTPDEGMKTSGGTPWVGFFSPKATKAGEVRSALGTASVGDPYVCVDGDYYGAGGLSFVLLDEFSYSFVSDDKNNITHAWKGHLPFGTSCDGQRVKDGVLTLMLLLPGADPVPEELSPAVVTVTDLRGVKAPAAVQHSAAVKRAATPEWAKANGEIASAVPPRFRIISEFAVETKTSRSGFSYALVGAASRPASVAALEALTKWSMDPAAAEAAEAATETFNARVNQILAVADKTPAI